MVDFKVAVEIMAAGNIAEFLSAMSHRLTGVNAQVKEVEKSLKGWGMLIGGAGLALGGVEVLKFVDHIAKAGGEMQRQANNFQAAGNSISDTAKAVSAAFSAVQKVPGVDAVDAMKRYRELAGATQDNAGSIGVLPDFLRAQVVYAANAGEGADAEDGMKRIAKMIELRQGAIDHLTHKIDPKRFDVELDAAVKALQVGQGLITANDLQMIIKQAGPMAKGLDPMRFWSIYLASVEDMGGARTGTAMTAVARQVLGGIMTPSVKSEWEKMGMLSPHHQGWHKSKTGEIFIDDARKAIVGFSTFNDEGMQAFVDKVVKPHLMAHGYITDKQINAELYRFGSTETARRLYSMYLTGAEQVEAEQQKLAKAQGLASYDSIYKGGDYQQGIDSLTASIKSLEEALGGPAGKAVGAVATQIAEQINKLALIAHNNPQIVQIGTYAVTAAAGLAVLGGSLIALAGAAKLSSWALGFGKSAPTAVEAGAATVGGSATAATEAAAAAEAAAVAGAGGLKSALTGGVAAGVIAVAAEWVHGEVMDAFGKWLASKGFVDTSPSAQAARSKEFDSKVFGKLAPSIVPPPLAPSHHDIDLNPLRLNRFDFDAMRAGLDREATRGRALSDLPIAAPSSAVSSLAASVRAAALPGVDIDAAYAGQRALRQGADMEAARGRALGRLPQIDAIGGQVHAALDRIPPAVNPAINSAFASITGALVGAINGMAASAASAARSATIVAAAIPTGGGKTVAVHTAVNLDGRKVAQVVTAHQMADNRTVSSTARMDGSAMPTSPDYAYT